MGNAVAGPFGVALAVATTAIEIFLWWKWFKSAAIYVEYSRNSPRAFLKGEPAETIPKREDKCIHFITYFQQCTHTCSQLEHALFCEEVASHEFLKNPFQSTSHPPNSPTAKYLISRAMPDGTCVEFKWKVLYKSEFCPSCIDLLDNIDWDAGNFCLNDIEDIPLFLRLYKEVSSPVFT